MVTHRQYAGIAALLVAATIWGVSFVLAKAALVELSVAHLLLYRFVFAVVPFLPFLLTRGHRPKRCDLWLFVLTGFLMVPVTFLLQVGGLTLTSATSAALLVGTGAPLLALAAVLFENERLGRRGWISVAVSSFGVLLLVGKPGAGDDWRGNAMVLASMVISTAWVIMTKRLTGRYPALQATGWILLFGTLLLIPVSLLAAGPPPVDLSSATWAALLSLGLGCTTLAYFLWNWGVAQVGAGTAGVYLNLEPIAGAVAGVTILGEAISAGMALGGAAILVAAGIVATRSSTAASDVLDSRGSWSWWLKGRPSLQAEYALRRHGGPGAPLRLPATVGVPSTLHAPPRLCTRHPAPVRPGAHARRGRRAAHGSHRR
jgi:drug/metabolite transporter (DMT)-like permease